MGKLSSSNQLTESTRIGIRTIWQLIKKLFSFLARAYNAAWAWLRLHIPFIEAIVQRHLNNPATIFIDLAVFVLTLYMAFGVTGATLIYKEKSESRFSEVLAELYPLPAAKVNSSFIWSHQYLQRLRFLNTFNAQAPSNVTSRPPTDTQLRQQIMDGLVENQILILEANKRGLSVSVDDVTNAYSAQKQQTPDLDTKIQQLYGMSVTDFKAVLAEKILKEKVKAVVLMRIKVSHILVTSLDAATKAKQDLAAGKSFADTAKLYSQDSQTKNSGGDFGYWTKGELATQIGQSFEDAAFKLTIGQVSDPVQTKFGYHIVVVTEKTGDNYQSYDDWYAQTLKSHSVKAYIGD